MKKIMLFLVLLLAAMRLSADNVYEFDFSLDDFIINENENVVDIQLPQNSEFVKSSVYDKFPYLPKQILTVSGHSVDSFSVKLDTTIIKTNVTMADYEQYATNFATIGGGIASDRLSKDSQLIPVKLLKGDCVLNGYSFSSWAICPFLYNSFTRELSFISHVELTVSTSYNRLRPIISFGSPVRYNTLIDDMLNQEASSSYSNISSPSLDINPSDKIEYLLVTTDKMAESFQPLVDWKILKGIYARLITMEQILSNRQGNEDDALTLKRYIYNLYLHNGLKWVTLGGDTYDVPTRFCRMKVKEKDVTEDETDIPTDMYFACFDNSFDWDQNKNGIYGEYEDNIDFYQEIGVSRISSNSALIARNTVDKILQYEQNPGKPEAFSKVLMAGALLHKEVSSDKSDAQVVSEFLRDECIIPYSQNSVDMLFDAKNDFLNGGFTVQNFKKCFSDGYGLITMESHGNINGVATGSGPAFLDSDASSLDNEVTPLILTIACETNHFDNNQSLSESFVNSRYGAIGYIGPSRNTIDVSNRTTGKIYGDRYNNLYMNFGLKHLFNASGLEYFRNLSDILKNVKIKVANNVDLKDESADRWHMACMNTMGDAETPILTDYTPELKVSLNWSGENRISLAISNSPYYRVCITDGRANPTILHVGEYTHPTISLTDVPRHASIVVTAPNRAPFISKGFILENGYGIGDYTVEADRIVIGNDFTVQSGTLTLKYKESIELNGAVNYVFNGAIRMIKQ